MSESPGEDRIARLIAELDELPLDEREAAIAALSDEDREAVREAELEATEEAMPLDDEELGGEG
jgi:isopropylmalate/homocitrate/citramalate synthase